MRVAYYVPEIPAIPSTTRYNHALALPEYADEAVLFTHSDPPSRIAGCYEHVHVVSAGIEAGTNNLGKIRPRVRQARRVAGLADDELAADDTFVTTFHYYPALAGHLADSRWVVDVYDDPYQTLYNSPRSIHQVLARGLVRLLRRADRAVHTIHPSSPRLFGAERRFAINGAPTDHVRPDTRRRRDVLACIWAGKPRLDRGMQLLVDALASVEANVEVSVFGRTDDVVRQYATEVGVAESVVFHGRRPHESVLSAIAEAHVGLCVLPPRTDWRHAYPVKIGEYLAGGTVPVCSSFPGMRELARGAGRYVAPTPAAIADALDELARADSGMGDRRSARCRRRAEEIAWSDERSWFARQVVERDRGG